MKSNVPWSIKGIDPDARSVAKQAAKDAGMTLGEWLNHQILSAGQQEDAGEPVSPVTSESTTETAPAGETVTETPGQVHTIPANVVTLDQLRELVYSLNRVNDRLKSTERNSREALNGLNIGLQSVLERVKRVEKSPVGDNAGLTERLEKVERLATDGGSVESLKALERALSQIISQHEDSQEQTLLRLEQTEQVTETLSQRLDRIDDVHGQMLEALKGQVTTLHSQVLETENSARAVILEARAAASSDNQEFIERTSNKMRILGNEIKRSGDQINELETRIRSLSSKIEASEQRSAEGITRVTGVLETLRTEMAEHDQSAEKALAEARNLIDGATGSARTQMDQLHGAFRLLAEKFEKVERAAAPAAVPAQPLKAAGTSPVATKVSESNAPEPPEPDIFEDDDFEEDFLPGKTGGVAQRDDATASGLTTPVPDTKNETATSDENSVAEETPTNDGPLTGIQKIIMARKAREERLQAEEALTGETASLVAEKPADDQPTETGMAEGNDARRLRERIAEARSRESSGNLLRYVLYGIAALVILGALAFFLRNMFSSPASITSSLPTETVDPGASPPDAAAALAEAQRIYDAAKPVLLNEDASLEDRQRALLRLRRQATTDPGHAPSQYLVARAYETGVPSGENPVFAKNTYEAAADAGNVLAMHRLGKIYASENPPDLTNALRLFKEAASYGYVSSMANLGTIYDPTAGYLPADQGDAGETYFWFALAFREGGLADDQRARNRAAQLLDDVSAKQVLDDRVVAWQGKKPDPAANDLELLSN